MLHQINHPGTPSDTRCERAVGAIAALHILVVIGFVVVLFVAVGTARADEAGCSAANILEEMATKSPDLLAKIERDAADIPNGKGLLWRIDADGLEPSWLYGTMHLSDPRILSMSKAAREAFEAAGTVVLELEDLQDLDRIRASMFANPSLTMLDADQDLRSLMSDADWEAVSAVFDERGVPLSLMSRMKPWLIFSMLIIPECETQRRLSGAKPLDAHLASDAEAAGKRLGGLETLEEQLSAMADLSLDLQVSMLVDIARLGVSQDDRIETMTQLYVEGETGLIMSAMLLNARETGVSDSGDYAEFEESLVDNRNHRMAERLKPFLADGGAFVAIGALHLPGEDGLVELLRDQGFRVTAVP